MNTLEGLPILRHYNNLLANANPLDAEAVLQEFFAFFDKESPQQHLWYMLVLALKNDSDEIEARHRSDMIFFYEYCIALFKAAEALCRPPKKSARRKNGKKK